MHPKIAAWTLAITFSIVGGTQTCLAQNPAFSPANQAGAEITTQRVGDGLYVLFGIGGNVAAFIGDQGVLIVDDQFPDMVPKIQAKIRELGGGAVDFAINTHWHYDHADGNQRLGPEGTWIIAHANSRARMTQTNFINTVMRPIQRQDPYPAAALPIATFDDRMQLYFNGEQIELLHFSPAHTTGDAAVFFVEQNAVHMGDVFNNSGYPFIDADNGGDLGGMIEFCESVLAMLPEDATVIPGHGAIADYAALATYITMLKDVRSRIAALIADGATLEQVVAAKPTAAWDAQFGDPTRMVDRAYATLSR